MTYRLGHTLLQLRQSLGKTSPAFLKNHEKELTEIYHQLQLVNEELSEKETNTQGTQTDRQSKEGDIID